MRRKQPSRGVWLALLTLTPAVAGCGAARSQAKMAPITPVQAQVLSSAVGDDYNLAKAAIARQDYGVAMDHLRMAAEREPRDARIQNAMGVVYDLLGDFGQSAQAYARAQALDPSLASVAQNIAYSQRLQSASAALAAAVTPPLTAPAPAASMIEGPRLVAADGATLRLELPRPAPPPPAPTLLARMTATPPPAQSAPAPPRPASNLAPGLTGHPLLVSNAGGREGAETAVRDALASRGWSAKIAGAAEPAATTRILYPPAFENVAKALARTLPGPARLTPCQDGCSGLRLLLGADVGSWKMTASPAGTPRRS